MFIDDGSNDETWETIKAAEAELKLSNIRVARLAHRGPAAARNVGILQAKGEIVAFTDADTVPQSNWLAELVRAFETEDVDGVYGDTFADSYLFFPIRVAPTGSGYKTCNIAYRKSALIKVGFFDERFKHPFAEDSELAHRVLKNGFRIVHSKKAIVVHPTKVQSITKVAKTASLRGYDVLFFTKHPTEARAYGERFMRPIFIIPRVIGLSITGVALVTSLILLMGCVLGNFRVGLTYLFAAATILLLVFVGLFVGWGYRLVLFGDPVKVPSIAERIRCAFALIVFYAVVVAVRVYSSVKYRVIMV
jgi:glycosyltransferase involved in cell wall biosynthesis